VHEEGDDAEVDSGGETEDTRFNLTHEDFLRDEAAVRFREGGKSLSL
jgi:hypothetical protein